MSTDNHETEDPRERERLRIREKMGPDMRAFLDAVRELFPDAKLQYIRFSDGETIGKPQGERHG